MHACMAPTPATSLSYCSTPKEWLWGCRIRGKPCTEPSRPPRAPSQSDCLGTPTRAAAAPCPKRTGLHTKAKPLLPQLSRMSMSIFVPSMSFSDQKMVPQNYSTIVSAPCGCGAVAKNVLKCNGSTLSGASTHLRTSRAASLNVIVNGPLPAPPQAPTKPKKSAVITLI